MVRNDDRGRRFICAKGIFDGKVVYGFWFYTADRAECVASPMRGARADFYENDDSKG